MRLASLLVKIPVNWNGCLAGSSEPSIKILKRAPDEGTGGQSRPQIDNEPRLSQDELIGRIMDAVPDCSTQLMVMGPGRYIGTVELERCAACRLMADSGCFMDSASNKEGGMMQWNVIAPNTAALRNLVSKVRDLGCQIEIEKISVLRTASELTVAQENVLQMAYDLGYFDIPRKITLDKLAKRLEISKANLDIMLRRAQKKLVASHIGEPR